MSLGIRGGYLPQLAHWWPDMHDINAEPEDRTFVFGPFMLRPAARRLEREGVKVALGDRALDILVVLIRQAGSVIPKRDLISLVWRNLTVDEGNLRVRLVELRRALDEPAQGQTYIANVKGQGYCFVGEVAQCSASEALLREDTNMQMRSNSSPEMGPETAFVEATENISVRRPGANEPRDRSCGSISVFEIELPTGVKFRATGDFDEARFRRIVSDWL
jgi:DNA-binding winged helix-turn-helix (wHTH) protein